jgi:hypothetical protein
MVRCFVYSLRPSAGAQAEPFARRSSGGVDPLAFNFFPFVRGCNYLGGALRFSMTRSYYDRQVALLPTDDNPRLAVFNWGGMIWASRGVVYDESDEIAMPPGQQSALEG